MAKKHHELDNDDWDLPELDDLDSLFDIDGGETQQSKLRRFTSGFKRGFLGGVKSQTTLNLVMDRALPDGYSALIDEGRRGITFARETREQVTRENASSLLNITEQAERQLPRLKRRLPGKRYEQLEQAIKRRKESLQYLIDANRTSTGSDRDRENSELAQMLAGIHASTSVQQEQRDQDRDDQETVEEGIRDQVEAGRFELTHEILTDIRNAQQRQVAYQDSVGHQIGKKGLELQFRSLFMLRDMRRLAGAQLALNRNAFESLIHNSSLPEHAKRKHAVTVLDSQQFNDLIGSSGFDPDVGRNAIFKREHLGHALTLQAAQGLQGHLRTYGPQVRRNIVDVMTRGLQGLDGAGSSAEMMADMAGMGDRVSTAGMIAGSGASSWAMSRLAPKLGDRLRPYADRLNERLGGRNHLLAYGLANAPSLIQDYVNDPEQSYGWRGILQNAARNIFPTFGLDGKLTDGGFHTIEQESAFNHLTQRSIVEIIPGYLSRILHEMRILRTGDVSLEREVYDITSGRFTGEGAARKALRDTVFSPAMRENVGRELDRVVQQYDPENQLTDEAREALRERLMRDSATGGRFDPEQYLQWGGYDKDTPDATLDELERFFRERFEFDEGDKLVRNMDNMRRLQEDSREFLRLRDVIPDSRAAIQRVYGTGSQEILRDLGLVRDEVGQDFINHPAIWDMYRGVGERGPQVEEVESTHRTEDYIKEETDRLKNWFRENRPQDVERLEAFKAKAQERVNETKSRIDDRLEQSGIKSRVSELRGQAESQIDRLKEQWTDRRSDHLGHLAGDRSDEARERILQEMRRRADQAKLKEEWNRFRTDLFTKDNLRNPRLLYNRLKEGHYFDAETNKVIESYSDIKGRVIDRFGNTVIAAEEWKEGLVDHEGRSVPSLREHLGRFNQNPHVAEARDRIAPLASRVKNKVVDAFKNLRKDIFVEGEERPRVRMTDLFKGKFFDRESGDPITDPDDIKGSLVTEEGNEVLSIEEIEKTVTAEGDPHPIRKNRSLLSRAGRWLGKKYWNLTKRYYGWLGRKAVGAAKTFFNIDRDEEPKKEAALPRAMRWLRDPKKEINEESFSTPTEGLLARMLNKLDRRLPPEAHRRGSWQDLFSRNKDEAGDDDKEEGLQEKEKTTSFLEDVMGLIPGGSILNRIKELFSGPGGAAAGAAAGAAGGSLLARGAKAVGRGAMWAGRNLLMKPAGWALRGGLVAGKGLVAALGWPVVLGAAAATGAFFLGRHLWRRYQSTKGDLQQLRMVQYGFDPDSHSQVKAALSMEAALLEHVRVVNGEVTINTGGVDPNHLLEPFGLSVDSEDAEHFELWNTWAINRFNPVLLAHLNAWKTHSPNSDFHELDTQLDDDTMRDYLDDMVREVGTDPYGFTADPFGGDNALTGEDTVQTYLERIRGNLREETRRQSAVASNPAVATHSGLTQEERAREQRQAAISRADSPTVSSVAIDAARAVNPRDLLTIQGRGGVTLPSRNAGYTRLQQLRLRTYGVENLESSLTRAILTIEDELYSRFTWEDGKATYSVSPRPFFEEFGAVLGVTRASRDYRYWAQWLQQRFIPVLADYLTSLKSVAPDARPANPEGVLDRFKRATIARAVFAALEPRSRESVFEAGVDLPGHSGSVAHQQAQILMAHFEAMEQQSSETTSRQETPSSDGSTQSASAAQERARESITRRLHESANLQGYQYQPIGSGVRYRSSETPGIPGHVGGFDTNVSPRPYDGRGTGDFVSMEGTGGVWEEIPAPEGEGRQHAAPTMRAAGAMTGIPWEYLFAVAGTESTWRFNVGPDTSSALGWFQFITRTWTNRGRGVFDRFASKYGIPVPNSEDRVLALRRDPRIATLMAAEFTRENYNALKNSLGRALTFSDLYMAHFLGAGGARSFLRALAEDGSRLGTQMFSRAAGSNPWVFRKDRGRGAPRTLTEIYEYVNNKIREHLPAGSTAGDFAAQDVPDPNSHQAPEVFGGAGNEAIDLMLGTEEVTGGGEPAGGEEAPFNLASLSQASHDPVTSGYSGGAAEGGAEAAGETPISGGAGGGYASDVSGAGMSDPVTEARQYRDQQARLADVQQRARTQAQEGETHAMGRIAEHQLEVQREMREYLRVIAERFQVDGVAPQRQGEEREQTTNDTSRSGEVTPPANPPRAERNVGQSTPAINTASRLATASRDIV